MTTAIDQPPRATPRPSRRELSRALLTLELRRLRLLLHRHVLWLRQCWAHDPLHAFGGKVIADAEADALLAELDEDAAAVFYTTDPTAARITADIHETLRAMEVGRAECDEARAVQPLVRLGRLFRLTSFERDVVLLCAAADLDPSFERLFAYAQDDADRRRPTPALALSLLTGNGVERDRARDALGPASTLRGQQLISIDDDDRPSTA